jgi:pyrrolidone-carboxylate peptidase
MHIPYAKEQGIKDRPSLPLSDITSAVIAALGAVADALS